MQIVQGDAVVDDDSGSNSNNNIKAEDTRFRGDFSLNFLSHNKGCVLDDNTTLFNVLT